MKKFFVWMILFLLVSLSACGSNSDLVGTWTATQIEIDGVSYTEYDEISEMMGDHFAEWSNASLRLTANGNAILNRPSNIKGEFEKIEATYSASDDFIEVLNPSDSTDFSIMEIIDGKIYMELSDNLFVIFEK